MNSRRARGLLARHHVQIRPENIRYIGKESNRLEEVESELEHDLDDVLEVYQEPVQTGFDTETLEALRTIPAWELAEQAGVSARYVKAVRNGKKRPSPKVAARLREVASRNQSKHPNQSLDGRVTVELAVILSYGERGIHQT